MQCRFEENYHSKHEESEVDMRLSKHESGYRNEMSLHEKQTKFSSDSNGRESEDDSRQSECDIGTKVQDENKQTKCDSDRENQDNNEQSECDRDSSGRDMHNDNRASATVTVVMEVMEVQMTAILKRSRICWRKE